MREESHRIRQARQRHLDRQGDLALDLLGGPPWLEGDHRDLGVGHVGEGLDRQGPEGDDAAADENQQGEDDQERLVLREVDQATHRESGSG